MIVIDDIYTRINKTEMEYRSDKCIQELIEEQAKQMGNKIAIKYKKNEISYQEVNRKANILARKLRKFGVMKDTVVGLIVNRSIDMIIGMLGIIKAGGAYLPIDPKFPRARINYMLEDSKTNVLVTQHTIEPISEYCGTIIYLDDERDEEDSSNLTLVNQSMDLAYMIYTSGSTGDPKGVMITHQNVINFIEGEKREVTFTKEKKILSLTTISFDIFVLESLLPLTVGMEIVIADPMNFAEDLQGETVDMVQTTPSTMQLILNDVRNHKYVKAFSEIMLGGEAFPERLLTELKKITNARIYNMYGPTETTVWSMIKELTEVDLITLGHPIANTQIYLIDEEGKVVSPGEDGEICIGGDGVARGYFRKTELTLQRFIKSQRLSGIRIYRTGDRGRILEDG